MIFHKITFYIFVFCFFFLNFNIYSQNIETLNRILVSISSVSISEIDYDYGLAKYQKIRKDLKHVDGKASIRTQVIDFLINRAILDIIAEKESIKVSSQAIENEIKRRMDFLGIKDEKVFASRIEGEFKLPYKIWKSEIPFELKKRQVIQIRLSMTPPTENEIKLWYRKNKQKLGLEVKFKMIGLIPKNNSISEESRVYEELKSIRSSLVKSPSTFFSLAKSSRNIKDLRKDPIFFKWASLFEVYKFDQNVAQMLSTMRPGTISTIFRDGKKRYVICKLESRRVPPLETVRGNIMNILYQEKENDYFYKWLKKQREKFSILYFDEAYIKENGIKVKKETFQLN